MKQLPRITVSAEHLSLPVRGRGLKRVKVGY